MFRTPPTFHLNAQRTGWNSLETILAPANVSSTKFGSLWNSVVLDSVSIGSTQYTSHLYATPLYIDDVLITGGPHANRHFSVIFAASSNGWVYAINAFDNAKGGRRVRAGAILWKKSLDRPRSYLAWMEAFLWVSWPPRLSTRVRRRHASMSYPCLRRVGKCSG